jgi:hypothetical protein
MFKRIVLVLRISLVVNLRMVLMIHFYCLLLVLRRIYLPRRKCWMLVLDLAHMFRWVVLVLLNSLVVYLRMALMIRF